MKCFVFVSHVVNFQRFVLSESLNELMKHAEVEFVVVDENEGESVLLTEMRRYLEAHPHPLHTLPTDPAREKYWNFLFRLGRFAYESRSDSFKIRNSFKVNDYVEAQFSIILARFTFPEVVQALGAKMGFQRDLLELVDEHRPDCFLLPSALSEATTHDVLQLSQALGIPTLLAVLGWDNVSSKGIIFNQPTHYAVWGGQMRDFAVNIQEANPDDISIIGAPHYDPYFYYQPQQDLRQHWGISPETKTIVFGGISRGMDEVSLLQRLDDAIEQHLLPPCKIIYRPHPYRSQREDFHSIAWKHVIFDESMRENYTNTAFQLYDIQRLADLYHAVDGLISPMSTVLLESLLFEVPILAVAFSHGKHDWSADKFSQSTHFQEFLQMEGVLITRDANTWIDDVRRLIERSNDSEGGKRLKEASKRFVHHSQTDTYAQRLWHVMKRMLSEHRVQYDSATLRRLRMVNQVKQRWNSPRLKPIRQFSMKLQRRIPILKNRVAPHLIDV